SGTWRIALSGSTCEYSSARWGRCSQARGSATKATPPWSASVAALAEPVLIWGGGGHGKVVADVARACGFSVRGFIDADPAKLGVVVEPGGASVVTLQEDFVGSLEREDRGAAAPVALAVGDNTARQHCA